MTQRNDAIRSVRRPPPIYSWRHGRPQSSQRRAATAIEAIVAFTLLTTVLSAAVPLVLRHGQLLTDHRNVRLALDELSNQLDRLTALPAAELPAALEQITPSEFAVERLPGVTLRGQLDTADIGSRVTLRLTWRGTQRQTPPLTLVGWVLPTSPQTSDTARSGGAP